MNLKLGLVTLPFVLLSGVALPGASNCRLSAPTYYIAGRASLITPSEIEVVGTTDLPAGAMLHVDISDFVGQGSTSLGETDSVAVKSTGFFEVHLHPIAGHQFRGNVVCNIVFMPDTPPQPDSVLRCLFAHAASFLRNR